MPITFTYDAPPEIRRVLDAVLPGWSHAPHMDAPIRAVIDGDGYRVTGGGADVPAADAWEAAHWIIAAMLGAAVEAVPGRVVLHAAGLRGSKATTVIAGAGHAGKSSVALHLAARGQRLLGDDRLVLDTKVAPPTVASIGLARKVRIPLPQDFDDDAVAYAHAAARPGGGGADLLAWDPAIDPPAGTADPIDHIVILCRDSSARGVRCDPLPPVEATAMLLPLCGRHAGDTQALVIAITALVHRVPVTRLTAPNSAMAAWRLIEGESP
ncbi:MAG: hypothetical protein HQ481_06600 [Alphaproteobacteria bacterium]|nr:hypothetical protein [Alphaproteobacteria bacterium]